MTLSSENSGILLWKSSFIFLCGNFTVNTSVIAEGWLRGNINIYVVVLSLHCLCVYNVIPYTHFHLKSGSDREGMSERKRELLPVYSLFPNGHRVRTMSSHIQESKTPSRYWTWIFGAQVFWLTSIALLGILARRWNSSKTIGSLINALVYDEISANGILAQCTRMPIIAIIAFVACAMSKRDRKTQWKWFILHKYMVLYYVSHHEHWKKFICDKSVLNF